MDITPIGSMFGAVVDTLEKRAASADAFERSKEIANYNDMLQRKLMSDAPSINKVALQKAGVSLATLNGNFGSTASAASATTPPPRDTVDMSTVLNSVATSSQIAVNNAQADVLNEDARRKRLENDELEDKQKSYRDNSPSYWLDDDGHKVYTDDPDAKERADAYAARHPGSLPEVIKESGHLSSEAYSVASNIAQSRNNYYQNLLGAQVAKLKMADKNVMYALSHMDKQTYDNLEQTGKNLLQDWKVKDNQIKIGNIDIDIRKIDKDIKEQQKLEEVINYKLLKLRYETERDTNIRPLVAKLLNNGLDMSTIGKLLVAVLLKQFNM